MGDQSYIIDSLDSIILRAPDPTHPNQLMTNLLINPAVRTMRLTADPDTIIDINGNSDSVLFQLSSDCFFNISANNLQYRCYQSDRLLANTNADLMAVNFDTIDINNRQVYLTTDVVQFDVSRSTIALIRPAPVSQQLYINETTNNNGNTNVCLRSSSATDEPTFIIQPNQGKLALYTQSNVSDGITGLGESYAPPLTLNIFGSQFIGSVWGRTYSYRLGGVYPTRTHGSAIIRLLDSSDTTATIDLSPYRHRSQMVQFTGQCTTLMRPSGPSSDNIYYNDFCEFTGIVSSTQTRFKIIRRDRFRQWYKKSSLLWLLTPTGHLNYEIRYNNRFNYNTPTQLHGILYITMMITPEVNGIPRRRAETSFSSPQSSHSFSESDVETEPSYQRTTISPRTEAGTESDSDEGEFHHGKYLQHGCGGEVQ